MPGKFHGQRRLAGYRSWDHKGQTLLSSHTHINEDTISGSHISSWVQFSSVAQSCLTLSDPMDCSTPGLPVHHQLPEFTQTHVHWVGDTIQPSHSLSSPSPPAFNLSQHQGLFQWVSSSNQVAKVSEFQFQHQSFQWIFRTIPMNIPMNIQDNEYSMNILPEGGSISVTKNRWQVEYLPGAFRYLWRCHFVTRKSPFSNHFLFLGVSHTPVGTHLPVC